MEPPPMILPKGIVFNIDRVYKEVASFPIVPLEKIWEYWHVYTTTFGKLKDPTANRLENFWWHVMGSDRRLLSGPTLARLFEQISNGPTFVPLKGPPNRYEGPAVPTMPKDLAAALAQNQLSVRNNSDHSEASQKSEAPKALASSSTKPPPPHPILKKPRGPSSSGPRPTARFVSPAGSDVEDDKKESEADSSTSATGSITTHLKPATTSAVAERHRKQAGNLPKKKIVASTSSKRRPAMPRRQSSQSSATGSEVGSREERPLLNARYASAQRPVSPIVEQPSRDVATKSKLDGEELSVKAAGKRLATTSVGPAEPGRTKAAALSQEPSGLARTDFPKTPLSETQTEEEDEPSISRNTETRERQDELVRGSDEPQKQAWSDDGASTSTRSQPDMGVLRSGSRESKPGRRGPPQGLLSTSTATTSNVAAQGTIIEVDENPAAKATVHSNRNVPSDIGLQRTGSTITLTPTAPSNTPTVPLGRSKSQLALLLERQGERKARH